ncbi:hypothetical protein D3C71_684980 [compost metagenome]
MRSGLVGGFPGLEIGQQLLFRLDVVGHLNRKAAGSVGAEMHQRDIAERLALHGRKIIFDLAGKRELAVYLGIGAERDGECLGDGAEFEQRLRGHGLIRAFGHDAIGEDVALTINADTNGKTGDAVLLHDRLDRGIRYRFQPRFIGGKGLREQARREQRSQCDMSAIKFHLSHSPKP